MSSLFEEKGGLQARISLALRALLLVIVTCAIYAPSLRGGPLMDDDFYVFQNPLLHSPAGLGKAWFSPGIRTEYYPIEQTVRWCQWHLWHDSTLGYHATNIFLHLATAFLVWLLLLKMGLRWAWLGGFLFAIHPANVESVAWISELKNTLSAPPFLLAACFYLDYQAGGRRRLYFLALAFFLVAMLCKVSMALFPFVLVLHAWWRRGRLGWADLREAAPFALVSLVLGTVTVACMISYEHRQPGGMDPVPMEGALSHFALAGQCAMFYLVKALVPLHLLFTYPHWKVDPLSVAEFWPWPAFALIFAWFWARRDTWGRHMILGVGYFLLLVAPFLGLNTSSYMRFTWVMDHYLYLPAIGLIALVVAGAERVESLLTPSIKIAFRSAGILLLALLAVESHDYARTFRNAEVLWTNTLRSEPNSWIAYNNRGRALAAEGRWAEAVRDYKNALRVNPTLAGPHVNLGNVWQQLGQPEAAMHEFQEALRLQPNFPEADNGWGNVLNGLGQTDTALQKYQEALRLDPEYVQARLNLGATLLGAGRLDDAINEYEQALRSEPGSAETHQGLGVALGEKGHLDDSIAEFRQATAIDPTNASSWNDLGVALFKSGRQEEAFEAYRHAHALGSKREEGRSHSEPAVPESAP